jgi:spore coat polysaccharide biosynthesis predicted glycosyltransferase SpsG
MGIPNVIVVLAENQRGIADGLNEAGTAINLGWHESVNESDIQARVEALLTDDQRRLQMARKAQKLVDGQGARRVLAEIKSKRASDTSPVEHSS